MRQQKTVCKRHYYVTRTHRYQGISDFEYFTITSVPDKLTAAEIIVFTPVDLHVIKFNSKISYIHKKREPKFSGPLVSQRILHAEVHERQERYHPVAYHIQQSYLK